MDVLHKIKHFDFFGFFTSSGRSGLGTTPASVCRVLRNARTRLVKSSSTLCAVLAEVSIKEQPKDRASATPSSFDTSLSYVLSHLLPTSINIGFCLFTRNIDCRKTSSRSNVDREAIEYTRMNPCPSLGENEQTSPKLNGKIHTEPIGPEEWHTLLLGRRSSHCCRGERM
jgi:hypothetical protein